MYIAHLAEEKAFQNSFSVWRN